jgi:2C-methyl-D-erythritol 2,4-cyclodiphosphate synthase
MKLILLKNQYSRTDVAFKNTKNHKCKMDVQDNVRQIFIIIINVDVRVSLRAPQLIPEP